MIPRSCNCMADQCAMWRWGEDLPLPRTKECQNRDATEEANAGDTAPADGWKFNPADPNEGVLAAWVEPLASRRARCIGYCGLAGMVEVVA